MCGGGGTPKVVEVDPKAEADKAANEAAAAANADAALRKKSRMRSALTTGAGAQPASSALSLGKTTLGA